MKRTICVFLTFILLLSFATAEEKTDANDWYYPYGLSDTSTFDEVVDTLLKLYPTDNERNVQIEGFMILYPQNVSLFDMPINTIIIKGFDEGGFAYIFIKLGDEYDEDGFSHYLEVLNFLMDNCKTEIVNIEPAPTTFDLDGNDITNAILNDLHSLYLDFVDRDKEMEYTISWQEAFIRLNKDSESYSVTLMFYSRAFENQE